VNKGERQKIEEWFKRAYVATRRSFDDLHIDEISESYKNKETWCSGALECLEIARSIAGKNQWNGALCLAFSLIDDVRPLGRNFSCLSDLSAELSETPPSLYYFHSVDEFRQDSMALEYSIDDMRISNVQTYYLEYREPEKTEYRRSFWVVAAVVAI